MKNIIRNEEEVEKFKIAIQDEIDRRGKLDEETSQIRGHILQIKNGLLTMCKILQVQSDSLCT